VFLGSLVTELGAVPADPTSVVLAIAAGTAVCTLGAPFASGTLMLARASGYSGVELTWKWNLAYTVISMAVLAGVYALLTSGIFM
jgi:di/tricarboxylate transporter